jgi:hypothetical protein
MLPVIISHTAIDIYRYMLAPLAIFVEIHRDNKFLSVSPGKAGQISTSIDERISKVYFSFYNLQ